jgi:hypothetical protein
MMYPIEPEDDYLCPSIDWDELYTEETFGDRLKLFYNQFRSNTRPLLDEALFRESVGGLVLLAEPCPWHCGVVGEASAKPDGRLSPTAEGASLQENRDGVVTGLEILCGSEIIYKRLVQKNQKIGNEIRWIWPETVMQFKIGFYNPDWFGRVFPLREYWLK